MAALFILLILAVGIEPTRQGCFLQFFSILKGYLPTNHVNIFPTYTEIQ